MPTYTAREKAELRRSYPLRLDPLNLFKSNSGAKVATLGMAFFVICNSGGPAYGQYGFFRAPLRAMLQLS